MTAPRLLLGLLIRTSDCTRRAAATDTFFVTPFRCPIQPLIHPPTGRRLRAHRLSVFHRVHPSREGARTYMVRNQGATPTSARPSDIGKLDLPPMMRVAAIDQVSPRGPLAEAGDFSPRETLR